MKTWTSKTQWPGSTKHRIEKHWQVSKNIVVTAIFEYSNDTGFRTMYTRVDNDDRGQCDYPIKYSYNGRIAYDWPERHSQTTKQTVARAYRWLEKQLELHRGK